MASTLIDTFEPKWNFNITGDDVTIESITPLKQGDNWRFVVKIAESKNLTSADAFVCSEKNILFSRNISNVLIPSLKETTSKNKWCSQTKGEGYNIFSEKTDKDIPKEFSFTLPISENSFKLMIGDNSTTVDASADNTALTYVSTNGICRTPNGMIHIAYEGGGADLWYGNSTDNGSTWSTVELAAGTFESVGIVCKSDNNLMIYYENSNDIDGRNSDDGGATWGSAFTIEDDINLVYFDEADCEADSNDKIHCVCYGDHDVFYLTSDAWDSSTDVQDDDSDDLDNCDLTIAEDDCVYISCIGVANDDLVVWSDCLNGWGNGKDIFIGDAANYGGRGGNELISTSIRNDTFYWTYGAFGSTYSCNATKDTISSASCSEVNSDYDQHAQIVSNTEGYSMLVYGQEPTIQLYSQNSTDGYTYDTINTFTTSCIRMNFVDHNYPTVGRPTDLFEYLCADNSGNLYFGNHTIPYTGDEEEEEEDSCTYSSGDHIYQCADNCNVDSVDHGGNNIIFNGTGSFNGSLDNYANLDIQGSNCYVSLWTG